MADDYEVLEINERTRLTDLNRVEVYYIARVRTAKGTLFTVQLGEEQLEPATAKRIIGARVKQLDDLKR